MTIDVELINRKETAERIRKEIISPTHSYSDCIWNNAIKTAMELVAKQPNISAENTANLPCDTLVRLDDTFVNEIDQRFLSAFSAPSQTDDVKP